MSGCRGIRSEATKGVDLAWGGRGEARATAGRISGHDGDDSEAAMMTIGRAARRAGCGVETVRFYERRGLIAQPPKPAPSGFRRYPEQTVARIRFIRQAQELGFSLREIGELLAISTDPTADAADFRERATVKLGQVDQKIRQLEHIRSALEVLIAGCPGQGGIGGCSIMAALRHPDLTS
jgi:MerR family copper efflux transcriptional regulator